ncbi:hypothetical protein RJ55_03625 [Drechmeria coniospora]|nr:hypothetical protein RJ55_03625 [Drechmeria coniospora]
MSRVTAPVSKLIRLVGSSATRTSHGAGAALMPKYADLLRNREHSEFRKLTTTHRPTPQPSLANRTKPLMQTFHTTSHVTMSSTAGHIDSAVFPPLPDPAGPGSSTVWPRVPLLPDNYSAAHGPSACDMSVRLPEISIVAANPENVVPGTPLSEVQGISLDGIELKFVHEDRQSQAAKELDEGSGGMIRDLWKGMVEDVLMPAKKFA